MVVVEKAINSKVIQDKIITILEKLDIPFKDISHYVLAFIHRSIVNERQDFAPEHNERLEFLGDAVLELAITNNLFIKFPDKPEGELTDIRSALVRGTNLSSIARVLWLPVYLLLWKWEEMSGGRDNDYLLANVVEALLWAIYLDLGISKATDFVNKYIFITLDDILKNNKTKDHKTIIQEYSQAEFEITPTYKVHGESGPDHDKTFEVWVYLWEKLVWTWTGGSKKKAQECAAVDWYNKIINNK